VKNMKTIIIYGSTYGYTKECAERLKEYLDGEVMLVDATAGTITPIDKFDNIVIGGSIYMGQIQKKVKAYCASNAYSGTSGRRFRKYPDSKPGTSGHLVDGFDFTIKGSAIQSFSYSC